MKEFLGYSVNEVAVGTLILKLSPAITLPKYVQKQKGSLAKTMALHVCHDFWYISQTFSAKHDKISKVKVVRILLSL